MAICPILLLMDGFAVDHGYGYCGYEPMSVTLERYDVIGSIMDSDINELVHINSIQNFKVQNTDNNVRKCQSH